MRLRLNLSYDGTAYKGWQVQPDVPTVQGKLETALATLFGGRKITVFGAGRTDTGVHAIGQVAHVEVPLQRPEPEIQQALNALLPKDINIWRVRTVPDDFHARYSAHERVYGYRILERPDVFRLSYAWFPPFQFDPGKVEKAAELFLGVHDFRRFATKPDPDEDTGCEVRHIRFVGNAGGWLLLISADRFLRRMVRTIVGVLLETAAGRFNEDQISKLLEGKHGRVGAPAPPHGLALLRVRYDIDDEDDSPALSLWGDTP